MHVILSTCHREKIFLHKDRLIFLAFQLIKPILRRYSKEKTHYDTLEVLPQSTQDEIKASYYKLSKLYHPDINKSELAKKNFQDISEAYEVLSNHQARKRYDRSIMVKINVQTYNPQANFTYASIYKSKTHPKRAVLFNFDEWNEKHYGKILSRHRENIKEVPYTKDENPYDKETEIVMLKGLLTFSIVFSISLTIYNVYYAPYNSIKTEIRSGRS